MTSKGSTSVVFTVNGRAFKSFNSGHPKRIPSYLQGVLMYMVRIYHIRNVMKSPSSIVVNQGQPANRVAEIMKYGFPSLNNICSYENFVLSYDRRNRNASWVFEHIKPELVAKYDYIDRTKSVLSYDRRNRNAYWVFEHIKPEHVAKYDYIDMTKSKFVDDNTIHKFFRATNDDYKKSGYDRGHLAAAANHRHSQKAMDQTFILSYVSPQVGDGFNRGVWNDLEKYVRAVARKNRNVYCCTGPLYLPRHDSADGKLYVKYQVIGKNNVAVPTHFFKVLLIERTEGQFELLSFVLPNQPFPDKVKLKNFLVPIDSIERAAGLLIFDKIPRSNIKSINGKTV